MKKKVLTIAPFLWSGAGKAIVRLLRELKARGMEVELVSSGRSGDRTDWPEYVREARAAGIPYHMIDFFDRSPSRVWQSIDELTQLLQRRSFDLIHVHSGVPAFAALVARDRLRVSIPIVATFHSWNPERPAWMNHADIWALNRCDHVITGSHSYQKQLESWGLDVTRSETIYLGLDLPQLDERSLAARRGIKVLVLSVGRIEPRKDQETLLRGFALFRRHVPQAVLCLVGPVGDSKYAERLKNRAVRYGWDRNVRFIGKVRNLSPWYRKADMYVSTSLDEGLGIALLEAMSFALPALCAAVDGHRDFIEDGRNARVVPIGDPARLAESMWELYCDPDLGRRLGQAARQTVSAMFDWQVTVQKYRDVYRSVLMVPEKQ